MVDLDPQQNLTELFLTLPELETQLQYLRTICGMFEPSQVDIEVDEENEFGTYLGRAHIKESIVDRLVSKLNRSGTHSSFDLIAGDHRSIKYVRVGEQPILFENFSQIVEAARKQYDVIVFDSNPSVSFFTRAVMENCDFILVPLKPDGFARRGVAFLQKVIEKFYELETRPQVNAVFNFVTTSGQPNYERDTIKGLKEGTFKGTSWLTGGYLDAQIGDSPTLRPKEMRTADLAGNLASSLISLVGNQADTNLKDFVDEYARKIGTEGPQRKDGRTG